MTPRTLRVALCALSIGAAVAQTPEPAAPAAAAPAARGPTLAAAVLAAQTAVEECLKIEQHVAVTILDAAGVHKAVLAADGASPRGVASSSAKALTALQFAAPTGELGDRLKTDSALAQQVAANPAYNTRAGGVPIRVAGEIIGAIGVGGARGSEKDEACALAGLARAASELK